MDSKPIVTVDSSAAPAPEPRKRWESPTIEEIDYGSTEFGPGIFSYADINTYGT